MDKLRRIGGKMESFRRPGGRRVLLPAEIELCKTIGITEDEYWYFVELAQAYNGKRPKEYDEIPYVVNMPFIGTVVSAIGNTLLNMGKIKPQQAGEALALVSKYLEEN